MNRPVQFGVLGCGRIARKAMVPALQSCPASELRAVASRREGVAETFAAEFGIPQAWPSYEALLADPEIDAVYIPASGDEHATLARLAAARGKHVLCEKPLTMRAVEAAELAETCRAAGVLLQEAFMWRHHPRTAATLALLADGVLGPLRQMNVSFSFRLDPADWRMLRERGGGALWDLGCYGISAARLFTGAEPAEVYARSRFAATGVDLSTQVALRFPGDVLANIDCSFEVPWRCRLELVGETGRLEWPAAFQHWDPVIHLWRTAERNVPPELVHCESANQYVCQVQAFCDSIHAGRLLPPAEDGEANMRVVEQADHCAREGSGVA